MNIIAKRGIVILLILGFTGIFLNLSAQYPAGHRTMTFIDPARSNRPIQAEIYYPAVSAGNNTPVAAGVFPVVVFGHGFLMTYSAYAYFHNAMVPEGYFVVFPTTEGSLFPNHLDLGKDLAFLVTAMKNEGENSASPFYQHVDSTSAVMGHSMGGGASFLACMDNPAPTVMVTFAAAETNPSAIAAASDISIPSLVFSASEDCVTPPATNQLPMYDSLASACKVYIGIKGGGHCYFADYNFQCSLGETGCQQYFTITRDEQHAIVLDFTKPYLDYYLKHNSASWILFNDSLTSSQRITFQKSCTTTGSEEIQQRTGMNIGPNPAGDIITIFGNLAMDDKAMIRIYDAFGRIVHSQSVKGIDFPCPVDVSALHPGLWIMSVVEPRTAYTMKFIKE